ncbi:MAG: ribonuclease P protein component [Defluviitaleaceae bacterium]|nr:ribonuclease P protein component [Defluviitaleaceae bacterium]
MQSIKKTKSFKTVYDGGRHYVNLYFVVYAIANNEEFNRLGVTVSKKVGNAVIRNRVRRLIKESCRLKASMLRQGFDIVIVARATVGELPKEGSFIKVDKSLKSLFSKLRLIKKEVDLK